MLIFIFKFVVEIAPLCSIKRIIQFVCFISHFRVKPVCEIIEQTHTGYPGARQI